jgi:hypothetical protein
VRRILIIFALVIQVACNSEDLRNFQTSAHLLIKGGSTVENVVRQCRAVTPHRCSRDTQLRLTDIGLVMTVGITQAMELLDRDLKQQQSGGGAFKVSPETKAAFINAAESVKGDFDTFRPEGQQESVAQINAKLKPLKITTKQFLNMAKNLSLADGALNDSQVTELRKNLQQFFESSDYQYGLTAGRSLQQYKEQLCQIN